MTHSLSAARPVVSSCVAQNPESGRGTPWKQEDEGVGILGLHTRGQTLPLHCRWLSVLTVDVSFVEDFIWAKG